VIIDRIVRACYAFGWDTVEIAQPALGWRKLAPNRVVDLDAKEYRTVTLTENAVLIQQGKRWAEVPIERTGEDSYLIHWRKTRTKGWTEAEAESYAAHGLFALGAKHLASEG
jgi:hypothetical protein